MSKYATLHAKTNFIFEFSVLKTYVWTFEFRLCLCVKTCQSREKINVIFGFSDPKYIYSELFGPLTLKSHGLALEHTKL